MNVLTASMRPALIASLSVLVTSCAAAPPPQSSSAIEETATQATEAIEDVKAAQKDAACEDFKPAAIEIPSQDYWRQAFLDAMVEAGFEGKPILNPNEIDVIAQSLAQASDIPVFNYGEEWFVAWAEYGCGG